MSNRFDDQNNIEMDIKTAFASWGKFDFLSAFRRKAV